MISARRRSPIPTQRNTVQTSRKVLSPSMKQFSGLSGWYKTVTLVPGWYLGAPARPEDRAVSMSLPDA